MPAIQTVCLSFMMRDKYLCFDGAFTYVKLTNPNDNALGGLLSLAQKQEMLTCRLTELGCVSAQNRCMAISWPILNSIIF